MQKYSILWLNSQNTSIDHIAKELSLTEKQIRSVIETTDQKTSTVPIAKSSASSSRSHNLMIRETAGKKTKSVAIMTGEASMINDEYKKQLSGDQQKNTDKYIYRPNK